ncbi:MAG: N-acetyl-gamma-glutamyl-phosphate reductase [Actinomycetota bacterium]|nr:N-acetyl-gamma-glutamyl-phosphate reductase [Actinomycetota bacterium]
MGLTAAIAGASGYAGGELLRLIGAHPGLSVGALTAGSNAGESVTSLHPHLPQFAGRAFEPTEAGRLGDADVVFLALPHGQSAALASQLRDGILVVDIGADHRLRDSAQWEKFYGGPHAEAWTYGLPELPGARARIAASRRIANPGCYVTAATLALAPLYTAGLAEPGDVVIVAASGTTGAGRGVKPSLMASEVMNSMSPYKVGGTHQHTPEIEQNLSDIAGEPVAISFTPILAPMPRGILATCTVRPKPGADRGALRAAFDAAYSSEPFVHLLAEGQWPQTGATLGSNSVHLQLIHDEHSGRVVVICALDNLTKGAAGQAVQNANIALGLDELAGLPVAGVAP